MGSSSGVRSAALGVRAQERAGALLVGVAEGDGDELVDPGAALEREIDASQEAFQKRLGIRPEVFAYPRGRKRDVPGSATSILQERGFEMAFTMIPGLVSRSTDRYSIPRIGMSHVNDIILFKVKLLGLLNFLVRAKNLIGL